VIEDVLVKKDMRISVPQLKVKKFKNILLYTLERCGGKPNVGETVLYKLLYFSDFNFYETCEEHLTGAQYRKLPYGPVPQKFDSLVSQMIEKGRLQRMKTEYHGYPQIRYIPLEIADLTEMTAAEKDVIDRVIDRFSDWTASAISDYSHKDMPWKATDNGDIIDYELAFYRESPFSVRNFNVCQIQMQDSGYSRSTRTECLVWLIFLSAVLQNLFFLPQMVLGM
jgi:uncharacterized phage-associated protein